MPLILIILIIILLAGVYPAWPHSINWGYGPFGGLLGVLLIVLLIMFLLGRVGP